MPEKEYIDREVLDDFKNDLMGRFIVLCFGNDYARLPLLTIGNVIDELYEKHSTKPAADVAEVRHGEWGKRLYRPDAGKYAFTCNLCLYSCIHSDYQHPIWAYCPNCGAKMDGKGEGE